MPHFERLWNSANARYQKYLSPYESYRELVLPECKFLAAEFEEWWTNEEPLGAYPIPVSSSQHGTIDFQFLKRLLSIAQVIHGLRPSKKNELLFENRNAAAAQVPGYHSVEFVGRLAEVEVYSKFIHHIGLSIRVARKRGYLNSRMVSPLEGDFKAADEVIRILGPGYLKRGAEDSDERENQKRLVKKEQKEVEKEQVIRDDEVVEAIGTNLKGFKNVVRKYSGSTKDKQYVLESLLGSEFEPTDYVYKDRKRPVVDMSGGEVPRVSSFKNAKQQRDLEQGEDGDDESVGKDPMEFQFDVPHNGTDRSQETDGGPRQSNLIQQASQQQHVLNYHGV